MGQKSPPCPSHELVLGRMGGTKGRICQVLTESGGGYFSLRGPGSKYCRLCRPIVPVTMIQPCFVRESSRGVFTKKKKKKDQAGFGSPTVVCGALTDPKEYLGTYLGLKLQIRSGCVSPVAQGAENGRENRTRSQRTGF